MTLSDLLTLRVSFRDPEAAARIQPAQANAYLAAHGWTPTELMVWIRWTAGNEEVLVPRETHWADYGVRIVELLNRLAEHEGRSPLVIFAEMVAREEGSD